jgi:UDP-N-acetylmuramate--L-alanine ligase
MFTLASVKKIYFIGIGGIGMSAIAGLASHLGYEVTGGDSDSIYEPAKSVLDSYSIKYHLGYDAQHIITEKPDLVVVGGGETNENIEVKQSIREGIPITSFPELLSIFTKEKYRIVVSGTHGKTTTSGLIALFLQELGYQPSFFIGGLVQDLQTSFRYTDGKFFVIEGDEYYASFFDRNPKFSHYRPNVLLINNIEMDHFDYFDTKRKLLDAFSSLVQSVPASGRIVANADDENVLAVLKESSAPVTFFSTEDVSCEWYAKFLTYDEKGMHFMVQRDGKDFSEFIFTKPGGHYMKNVLAALATIHGKEIYETFYGEERCLPEISAQAYVRKFASILKNFKGAKRRFEILAEVEGIKIIDDYAHHPTAVAKTLDAAKKVYPESRLWAVFEPHTYSRTKATLSQLTSAFFAADYVLIPEIYAAREKHLKGIMSGSRLAAAIKKKHKQVLFLPQKRDILEYLLMNLKKGDVVVVMSVGDFHEITHDLVLGLRGKS